MDKWILAVGYNHQKFDRARQLWLRNGFQLHLVETVEEAIEELPLRNYQLVVIFTQNGSPPHGLRILYETKPTSILVSSSDDNEHHSDLLWQGAAAFAALPPTLEMAVATGKSVMTHASGTTPKAPHKPHILRHQNLLVDSNARVVTVSGVPVPMSMHDIDILILLLTNQGRALHYESIYLHLHDNDIVAENVRGAVQSQVKRLRKKLLSASEIIKSVWGVGYRIDVE